MAIMKGLVIQMSKTLLAKYKNGNYNVILLSDGTKIRYNDGEDFKPKFPENIDIKMTNWCDIGCAYCHERSSTSGKPADFNRYKSLFNSLKKGTELAMGGGKMSSLLEELPNDYFHLEMFTRAASIEMRSDIEINSFLSLLLFLTLKRGIIVNMTFNSNEVKDNFDIIVSYCKANLIYGVGVSYSRDNRDILLKLKKEIGQRLVIHTIAGITQPMDYYWLADNGFKVLILGFKDFGRGYDYKRLSQVQKSMHNSFDFLERKLQYLADNCETLSFDNLAIEQLHVKSHVSKGTWETHYMGDDGRFTMYIDLVEGTYATNSTTPYEERLTIPENDQDVSEMFKNILNK